MIRHAVAVAVTLCLSPSWLCAQSIELTVNVESASVHKAPSTGSPVIGRVPRGIVLEVTRELGSWVRIAWPSAQDGVGYVHVSMGSIAPRSAPVPTRAAAFTPPVSSPASASPTTTGVVGERTGSAAQPAPAPPVYIAPPTHIVGLGGRMSGSTLGFGATARAWTRDRLGVQLEVTRSALTSAVAPQRLTSVQFGPSLLYSLRDRVTDYVWMRPYLGAGAHVYRSTLSGVTPDAGASVSDQSLGFQTFGGAEVTFPNMPRFALSADLGYRWSKPKPLFADFELSGMSFAVSGHWYVR